MAAIDMKRSHGLGIETARARAEELARDLEGKLGIDWRWEGDTIRFKADSGKAKGVSGKVAVTARDVHVAIDLPLLLRALKGTIQSKVDEKLTKMVS